MERRRGRGEKRYTRRNMAGAVLLTVLATLCAVLAALWAVVGTEGLAMLEAFALIQQRFVGEYERSHVLDGAVDGMVEALGDQWSYYLNAEGSALQRQARQNTYVGVGVIISYEREEGLLILSVEEGSPAEAAGLRPGELIAEADGVSLAGEARYGAVDLIRGEEGTDVTFTVLGGGGASRTVSVTRRAIESDPVSFALLEGGVGLVTLKNFFNRSSAQFQEAVETLLDQGADALVFDLRNNPGGYLHELTAMLDYLLPEGPIFRSRNRAGRELVTESDASCVEVPMAVLVNGDSYSAAEFFAAGLLERDWAVVVGTRTSGKGYSQQNYPLVSGGSLNLSTNAYFTGEGHSLVGAGVTPDPLVELDEADVPALLAGVLAHGDDVQLQAALTALAGPGA
ncbi:MAG: S41 family peptidase [Clostridiales bacterium]|nr:S41 family peptidase [Clostridiales bacterium]